MSWNLKKGENMESFQGSTVSSQWLWLHLDTYGQVEEQHSKSSQEKGWTVSLDIMHSGCFTHKVWDTNTHTHQNTSCIHEVQPDSSSSCSYYQHGDLASLFMECLWFIDYEASRQSPMQLAETDTRLIKMDVVKHARSEENNTSCPHFMLATLKHNWAAAAIYKLFYGQK